MAAQQKWGKRMNIGDEVIIAAKVVGITESNNPIIQVKSGVRMLIKESDIKMAFISYDGFVYSDCQLEKVPRFMLQ